MNVRFIVLLSCSNVFYGKVGTTNNNKAVGFPKASRKTILSMRTIDNKNDKFYLTDNKPRNIKQIKSLASGVARCAEEVSLCYFNTNLTPDLYFSHSFERGVSKKNRKECYN